MNKMIEILVQAIQPVGGANPQIPGAVCRQGVDRIVDQTQRIVFIVHKKLEFTGLRIETIQPVACADPQNPASLSGNKVTSLVS